jgi:hypothetical protein
MDGLEEEAGRGAVHGKPLLSSRRESKWPQHKKYTIVPYSTNFPLSIFLLSIPVTHFLSSHMFMLPTSAKNFKKAPQHR